MNNDNKDFVKALLKKLYQLNYIKPGEVPNINLYMDQVTTFMDEHLQDSKRHVDDKILTKTMINNYTKNDLLPPPVKKKYSKDHIYILTYIYYLKNFLSISDIQTLLDPITQKFFENNSTPDLDDIYREIYTLCKSQVSSLSRDVFTKAKIANEAFDNLEDSDDKEFLQRFSLVCQLCFDVYMKKIIIENIIDGIAESENSHKDKKESKSEKMAEKKSEKKEKDDSEKDTSSETNK